MAKNKNNKIIAITIAALAVVAVGVAIIVAVINSAGGNVRSGSITSFLFNRGYGLGGAIECTLTKRGNSATLKYDYYGYNPDEDKHVEKTIDAKYLDELAGIISKNDVAKWDGFDESEDGVLDGSGFTLKIEYDDGETIDVHGYMKYPDDYEKVEDALDEFLHKLIDEA